MNIQSAIIEGTNKLKNKNISSAKLDAEILMMKVLGENQKYILMNNDKELQSDKLKHYKSLVLERLKRKPVAYLTNKKYFWKYEFLVTQDTLIPRPDTELLIENVLNFTKNRNKLRVLDIGIGSGCILLSILSEKNNFSGIGIDINKNSINISKINAKRLKIYNRVKFYKSDVDKFVLGKYDLIVSNPPYICKNDLKYLDEDIVKFEPNSALDGGLDGLSEIRKVINKSSELIKKNGKFILEIGFDQKNKVISLLKKEGFYINSINKDLANNDRCIVCTKI